MLGKQKSNVWTSLVNHGFVFSSTLPQCDKMELTCHLSMAAMCNVSATETAIIYGLEPIWGAGFAWFLLGERWSLSGWIGAALVIGGSLSVQILGASSSSVSGQVEKVIQDDKLSISHKGNNIHASPLVISCKEDPTDLLRKS
ncbi:hypothetical protein MTR67_022772 [Solanum verrucosum]|uniref:EamA domain-containing protein n=1 Tax=Solanum verrucosum TaxID=315347 RepID=A0AAF0QVH3_SOLVR|nr:hypothetical protein MTR67_022772 [Solanum verrucosum]